MFSLEMLNRIRAWELERIASCFQPGARILEIGGGTGQQALALSQRGFRLETLDLVDSEYAGARVFQVTEYDGSTIPFPDDSFDFVFSSNVLEHVENLPQLHSEIARVLKPGGSAIHVLPTPAWRFWTTVTTFPAALQYILTLRTEVLPRRPWNRGEFSRMRRAWGMVGYRFGWAFAQQRHGSRGNVISELWLFRAAAWRRNFLAHDFQIVREYPLGLFYTGPMIMGVRLSMERRVRMARLFGSACRIFVLQQNQSSGRGTEVVTDRDGPSAAAA